MNGKNEQEGLVGWLLDLPIFEAEWVLWLLLVLSLVSVAIMAERIWFFHTHGVDSEMLRKKLGKLLDAADYKGAAKYLEGHDSLESNVVLFGLRQQEKGPDAVEDLLAGAEAKEKLRYKARLSFLATVGSNAPFIGLFGTVLGIIKSFNELGADLGNVSGDLMNGISEALVATGVGLIVAIPAVIAFNYFVGKLENLSANTELLSRTLLSHLKSIQDVEA